MNHKLRVLVRVGVNPGHVTLEVAGCVTQTDIPALLHVLRRTGGLEPGADVHVDLRGASHLDPEMLLQLRGIAAASQEQSGAEQFRVTLDEPAELPICLLHVGSDGGVLADLEVQLAAAPSELGSDGAPHLFPAGPDGSAPEETSGPSPLGTLSGPELADYFEGTLDPAATVRALSDAALGELTDALYRHLDTSTPSFGAHTWYELAAEELQSRYPEQAGGRSEEELASDETVA